METIAKLRKLLKLLEDIVHFIFTPEIIGDHICSDYYLILLSLSSEFGALGIPIFHEIACSEYKNSKKINIVFVWIDQGTVISVFCQQLSVKEI